MTTTSKTPKSFTCETCKTEHQLPGYVFAHWDEPLTHTCDCGAKHRLIRGQATQTKKGKTDAKAGRTNA